MAATCAACMQPITKTTRFVLSGTEAFHRSCAMNMATSRANQQALRVLEVERMIEISQRGMAETKRVCDGYLTRANHAVAAARAEAVAAHAAQVAAENTALVAQRACRELTSRLANVTQARDEALRERDAARSEAALHQRMGPTPAATEPAATVVTAGKVATGDDAEQRFAAMELD